MTKEQEQIKEFMVKAGQVCPVKPTAPNPEVCLLRLKLIAEELCELAVALREKDLSLIADAVCDLRYVVTGTAVACGIDEEPCFQEVHRSNMTKFIDGHKRSDSKWIKGPSYSPANLKPIIERQIHGND